MIEKLQNLIDKNKDCFKTVPASFNSLIGKIAFIADDGNVTDNEIYHTMAIGIFMSEPDEDGYVKIQQTSESQIILAGRYVDGY